MRKACKGSSACARGSGNAWSQHDLRPESVAASPALVWLQSDRRQLLGLMAGKDVISRVSEKGPVRMTIRVSPAEPRLSDLVNLEIEVVAPEQIEIKAPTFGNAVGDFLVRDYHEDSSGTSSESKDRMRKFRYELEPVHSGVHLIRSVVIEFVDHRDSSEEKDKVATIASDPIEVKVSSMLDDQVPDLGQLEGMLPPQPLEENHRYWWVWGLLLAILLLLIAFRFLRRRASRSSN
jgi:hypothetical protein